MYNSYKVPLRAFLPTLMRPILAAQLRRIRGVVAASADDKEVVLYYKGLLDMRAITRFIRQFEDKRGVKKEEKSENTDWDNLRVVSEDKINNEKKYFSKIFLS